MKFNTFNMRTGLSWTQKHKHTQSCSVLSFLFLFCQHDIADKQLAFVAFAVVLTCHLCYTYHEYFNFGPPSNAE